LTRTSKEGVPVYAFISRYLDQPQIGFAADLARERTVVGGWDVFPLEQSHGYVGDFHDAFVSGLSLVALVI
jgi:hypothetical protein